ncbi:MAG: hypothetical protein LBC03_06625 [Nitrososphaerota archaeon]|jgi:hypothetical protein|nr:hypothetical protein [Nitrososphaerota archaeon]
MTELDELRILSFEFRRVSSDLLRTIDNDGNVQIVRFLDFINNNTELKKVIDNTITKSTAEYNRQKFFPIDNSWTDFVIPPNKNDHVKFMWNFLNEFLENKNVSFFASQMNTHGMTYDASIQRFISRGFKPLIDILNDNLTKRIMLLEQKTPKVMQTFHGPTNLINNTNGVATANMSINQNDLDKVSDLIKTMQAHLSASNLDDSDKECADEDLKTIHTQIHNEKPKKSIIERAIANIQGIIDKFGGATQFVIFLKELLGLLGKMGLYIIS